MAFVKNRPLLTQFLQRSTNTLNRRAFRQVLPKFPFPCESDLNRHQIVMPRPAPIQSDYLAKIAANKYNVTNYIKPPATQFVSGVRKKWSDNDEGLIEDKKPMKPMDLYANITKNMESWTPSDAVNASITKTMRELSEKLDKIEIQPKQSKVQNPLQFQQNQRQQDQLQQQPNQPDQGQDQHHLQLPEQPQQKPPLMERYFEKVLRIQHDNMQRIKERDTKLRIHVEKLKIQQRIQDLMDLQQRYEEMDPCPYVSANQRNNPNGQLKSSKSMNDLKPLRSVKSFQNACLKRSPSFAPYTPFNEDCDNGDVASKSEGSYHFRNKTTGEPDQGLASELAKRESAIYQVCKNLSYKKKNKF